MELQFSTGLDSLTDSKELIPGKLPYANLKTTSIRDERQMGKTSSRKASSIKDLES